MIDGQQTIFPLLFNGTDTSRDAALSMRGRAVVDRERILGCIAARRDGMTCDEVEVALGMSHQSCSARVHDLAHCQPPLIRASDQRRLTRGLRKAIVWVVA